MSYIGRGIDQIDNISTLDNLSFSGSTATFNLTQNSVAFVPVSADALQIQIDGVIQSGNYTVSGSTVTFDFTPSGSSVCNGIKHFGVGVLTTVSDGAVTNVKLGADSVNGSKIADDSISDEHLDITAITGQTAITSLADTDKFLVSDASDSGNLKYVEKQYVSSAENWDGWKLIRDTTISTGDSYATLTGLFSDTYENYVINFMGLQSSSAAYVLMQMVTGSNTVVSSSSYTYAGYGQQDDNTKVEGYSNGAQDKIYIQPTVHRNDEHMNFQMWLSRPKGIGTYKPTFHTKGAYVQNSGTKITSFHNATRFDSTTEVTGFKIFPSAGTFNDLQIQVLGGNT